MSLFLRVSLQTRSRHEEERREAAKKSAEDEETAVASMRLAYQDLSVQRKRQEDRLRHVDPAKAAQVERLGMGAAKGARISHSAITEMNTITQEEPRGGAGPRPMAAAAASRRDYDDDDLGAFGGFR